MTEDEIEDRGAKGAARSPRQTEQPGETGPGEPGPRETEERRRVWVALADLFLDTELDDAWLGSIADVLVESGFTWSELDGIFRFEVAPALGPLPYPFIGEWQGFDPDRVCAEARKRMRGPTWIGRLSARLRLRTWMADAAWRDLKSRFEAGGGAP